MKKLFIFSLVLAVVSCFVLPDSVASPVDKIQKVECYKIVNNDVVADFGIVNHVITFNSMEFGNISMESSFSFSETKFLVKYYHSPDIIFSSNDMKWNRAKSNINYHQSKYRPESRYLCFNKRLKAPPKFHSCILV